VPLDPVLQKFLGALAAAKGEGTRDTSVDARRRELAEFLGLSGPPAGQVASETVRIGVAGVERALRVYTPEALGTDDAPALLFFHGGGLVAGDLDTHDGICRALCRASGIRILSFDYPLAPEARFPQALEECVQTAVALARDARRWRIQEGAFLVGGDSAGANLAAVLCQELRVGPAPTPDVIAGQFLLCPILDYAGMSASKRSFGKGYLLDQETLDHDLRHYLPQGIDASDPRISPLRAPSLEGLATACIHTAEYDPLRDEGNAYAERLRDAGVRATYYCHPGMVHLFYGMAAILPYARQAFARMGEDIRGLLP
jgi:acetyl esterase/lipase